MRATTSPTVFSKFILILTSHFILGLPRRLFTLGFPTKIMYPTCVCVCGGGWRILYTNSLWVGRFGDRIPVGVRFSAPVLSAPGAHPASHTMDTRPFSGLKRPERGVDHPPTSNAEAEVRVELYICFVFGPS